MPPATPPTMPPASAPGEITSTGDHFRSGLFPFDRIRDGQEQFLTEAREVMENGLVLLAHAPTGIGKTAAALAAALEYARKHDKIVFFLTSKQSQHRIAVETLRLIEKKSGPGLVVSDIIAKQHMCPRDLSKEFHFIFNELCQQDTKTGRCPYKTSIGEDVIAELSGRIRHVEEIKEVAMKDRVCPHRAALELASRAHVVICDYNYMFSDISTRMHEAILDRGDGSRDLSDVIVIVDEAHNLPDRICDHLSDELTLNRVEDAVSELRRDSELLARIVLQIGESIKQLGKELPHDTESNLAKSDLVAAINRPLQETIDRPLGMVEFINQLIEIGTRNSEEASEISPALQLAEFLRGWIFSPGKACSRIFDPSGSPGFSGSPGPSGKGRLRFKLLDPSEISAPIFRQVHAGILMSGTLHPTEMYADLLGIPGTRTVCSAYPSPFPRENRKIIITKNVTTRYRDRGPVMYERIGNMISDIGNAIYENMAVFFPSYGLMNSIWDHFPENPFWRIYMEKRGMRKVEKEDIYRQLHMEMGSSRAMLWGVQAGSLSEGVDYEENVLKAVIVVGLPLSPPSLEVQNLEAYYSEKFGRSKGRDYAYVFPAVNRVLQAAGRGIRSEEDVGVIVLMDSRFNLPGYRRCLPADYDFVVTDDPAGVCKEFFEGIRGRQN